MTPLLVIFILVALVTTGAALMVVVTKNMVHAALWLVLALFGIAVLFVLLSSGFLAVAQVIIYIGAIAGKIVAFITQTGCPTSNTVCTISHCCPAQVVEFIVIYIILRSA